MTDEDFHQGRLKMDEEFHRVRLKLAEKFLLSKATNGELWAVQHLLLLVSEAIADGVSLTPGIAVFVSDALRKIWEGEKADDAFGIKRKRGERDLRAARSKQYRLADAVERFREDMSLEKARERVAEETGISENTIKKAWVKYHREVKRDITLEKKHLGKVMPITIL